MEPSQPEKAVEQPGEDLEKNVADLCNRALSLCNGGQCELAIESCRAALKLNPRCSTAYAVMGVALRSLSRFEEALTYLGHAISTGSDLEKPLYLGTRASIYLRLRQYALAVLDCQTALELLPEYRELNNAKGSDSSKTQSDKAAALKKHPYYFLVRANVYLQLKQFELAVQDCRTAIELDPENCDGYCVAGVLLYELSQFEEAVTQFDKALELEQAPTFYWCRARAYRKLREYELAIQDCLTALQLNPNYSDAYNEMGMALLESSQLEEAVVQFGKAIEVEKDPVYFRNRAKAYRKLKQLELAIQDCRAALQLSPKCSATHNELGIAFLDSSQLEEAVTHFGKAIELEEKPIYFYNRAKAYRGLSQFELAIKDCVTASRMCPEFSDIYNEMGLALLDSSQLEEAITQFGKAISLEKNQLYFYNRARAYQKLKQFGLAIQDYCSVLQLNPNHSAAYNEMGLALVEISQPDEAIIQFGKAIKLENDPAYFRNRARAFRKLKEYDLAIRDCQSALLLNPNYSEAYNEMGMAYLESSRLEEAVTQFGKAIELEKNPAYFHNRSRAYRKLDLYELAILDFRSASELCPNETIKHNPRKASSHGYLKPVRKYRSANSAADTSCPAIRPDLSFLEAYSRKGLTLHPEHSQTLEESKSKADSRQGNDKNKAKVAEDVVKEVEEPELSVQKQLPSAGRGRQESKSNTVEHDAGKAEASHVEAEMEAVDHYIRSMSSACGDGAPYMKTADLEAAHERCREKAIKKFKEAKKGSEDECSQQYLKNLAEDIKARAETDHLKAKSKATEHYMRRMERACDKGEPYVKPVDLKAAHERYLEEAAKVFIGEKKAEDAEYFKRYLKRLAKDVGEQFRHFTKANDYKTSAFMAKAETEYLKAKSEATAYYIRNMEKMCGKGQMNSTNLETEHKRCLSEALNLFDGLLNVDVTKLYTQYQRSLINEIEDFFRIRFVKEKSTEDFIIVGQNSSSDGSEDDKKVNSVQEPSTSTEETTSQVSGNSPVDESESAMGAATGAPQNGFFKWLGL